MRIAQPRHGEPIQLVFTNLDPRGNRTQDSEPRYRVTLDAEPYPSGKRRQVRTTHATLTAARAHIAAHRADRDRGVLTSLDRRRNRQAFDAFAESWIAVRERTGKIRPNTAVGYRSAVRRANAAFGAKSVHDVTEEDIERMAAAITEAGRTQRSAAFTLFVVRAVFKEAMRRGLVSRNPAEFVEASGKASKPREALTTDEVAKLRRSLSQDRLFACWLLTIFGLRRSEVLALVWPDVDLSAGTLAIERGRVDVNGRSVLGKPKTQRGTRTLPLPPDVLGSLRKLRKTQLAAFGAEQARTGYMAVNEAGEPMRPERWTDLWREHCRVAGVPAVTLHGARHSSVTTMRNAGVPDHIVAAWHGHDEVVMRRTYSHAHPAELAAAGNTLSEAFGSEV